MKKFSLVCFLTKNFSKVVIRGEHYKLVSSKGSEFCRPGVAKQLHVTGTRGFQFRNRHNSRRMSLDRPTQNFAHTQNCAGFPDSKKRCVFWKYCNFVKNWKFFSDDTWFDCQDPVFFKTDHRSCVNLLIFSPFDVFFSLLSKTVTSNHNNPLWRTRNFIGSPGF